MMLAVKRGASCQAQSPTGNGEEEEDTPIAAVGVTLQVEEWAADDDNDEEECENDIVKDAMMFSSLKMLVSMPSSASCVKKKRES